jgi:hypothetical protein
MLTRFCASSFFFTMLGYVSGDYCPLTGPGVDGPPGGCWRCVVFPRDGMSRKWLEKATETTRKDG